MMNPKMPKSRVFKTRDPGSGGGLETLSKSQGTKQMGKMAGKLSAARGARGQYVNPRGGSKVSQGGESEGASTGISRTNKGRQRL